MVENAPHPHSAMSDMMSKGARNVDMKPFLEFFYTYWSPKRDQYVATRGIITDENYKKLNYTYKKYFSHN